LPVEYMLVHCGSKKSITSAAGLQLAIIWSNSLQF